MHVPHDRWKESFGGKLGMTYTMVEPGRARAVLEVRDEHLNPTGVCHGGVLFTFADDSMGAVAFKLCPEGHHPSSNQLNIHLARSVRAGDRITVETNVLSHGRRTALLESRLTDDQGRLVALVTASYLFIEDR